MSVSCLQREAFSVSRTLGAPYSTRGRGAAEVEAPGTLHGGRGWFVCPWGGALGRPLGH